MRALVFGGTLEGRLIAEYLANQGVETKVCVATEYGASLFTSHTFLRVQAKRLVPEEMVDLMKALNPSVIIDATHPYAQVVTRNVKEACEICEMPYLRLLRPCDEIVINEEDTVVVENTEEAIAYLEKTVGNIFLTTGSKELEKYTQLTNYKERIYARVLSLASVVGEATAMGIEGKHLICMQGPFSYDINVAMMKQVGADILVTKESGKVGGFEEKYEAARSLGMKVVIIGRPVEEKVRGENSLVNQDFTGVDIQSDVTLKSMVHSNGLSFACCKERLDEIFHLSQSCKKTEITIVGIGMGNPRTMTIEAKEAVDQAQLVIGARRMVEAVAREDQAILTEYNPDKVKAYIEEHTEYQKIAIVQSGDVGFYSGAKKLIEVLGTEVKLLCGISSPVYFCSKLQIPWSNVKMASLHGRQDHLIGYIKHHRKVFSIVGECDSIGKLCGKLVAYGMGHVDIFIGEKLSYADEKITVGKARDLTTVITDSLAVVLIENKEADKKVVNAGMADEVFLRDKVPMTKEEVRAISIAKLQLQKDSVLYDIGAGTGSVSIEAAERMEEGHVFAIEKNGKAVELLKKNKILFGAEYVEIIEGLAPKALEGLPVPTHAFIGGSSGNLKEIMELLLEKNPTIRMVINAITLETVSEALVCVKSLPVSSVDIASVTVAKSESLGSYHLMRGMNPVYVISCTGKVDEFEL